MTSIGCAEPTLHMFFHEMHRLWPKCVVCPDGGTFGGRDTHLEGLVLMCEFTNQSPGSTVTLRSPGGNARVCCFLHAWCRQPTCPSSPPVWVYSSSAEAAPWPPHLPVLPPGDLLRPAVPRGSRLSPATTQRANLPYQCLPSNRKVTHGACISTHFLLMRGRDSPASYYLK